jgi:enoyl-[acyl-carrier protein] reductase I
MVLPMGRLEGRRGLIVGVANERSLAWAIAQVAHREGATLAITYAGDAFERRVRPLAESIGAPVIAPCDVTDPTQIEALFRLIDRDVGGLDFVVHGVAFARREELSGTFVDTPRDGFTIALDVSAYSFIALARAAAPRMSAGGSLLTLTFQGAQRVFPNYNVMGVAKAALEASVRYLAADLGRDNIRVNALSPGPMRTLAGSVVSDSRNVFKWYKAHSPMRKTVDLDNVGGTALYLLSDLSAGVTGEVHYVDAGFNVMGMPQGPELKSLVNADGGDA